MSGYDDTSKRHTGTGCCGTNCSQERNESLEDAERIRSCYCQENVGCIDRADCGGFRPWGTAATGACPGPCQCSEEEAWNLNRPPKPNCEWLANFSELRQQWSDHARKLNCKCCSCTPQHKAAPCKPCLPPIKDVNSSTNLNKKHCDNRLGGGACCSSNNYKTKKNYYPNDESNDEPCAPSTKPILKKKRSCEQTTPKGCMCQPMPRTCNCPHPVQVDVRADRECTCACPSSPECACPPSERKFSRAKVKCQNAKLCYTPRQQPGPKCRCTECQPSLPPPCDPCTSTKCRPLIPIIPNDKQIKYNNKLNHHHDDRYRKSSPCANNRKTKFSNLDRTECCSPLFYQASEYGNYGKLNNSKLINGIQLGRNNNSIGNCKNDIGSYKCLNCCKMNLNQSRECETSLEQTNQFYLNNDDSMENYSNSDCCCCFKNNDESQSTLSSNEPSDCTLNVNIHLQQSCTSLCSVCNNR
ncbi:balbiani ring protein 3-like [Aphidius gifuensis]|uniref:balbiani ring protein 3-like n=1 Tax=Aphidius gifuensis TaxID=684658 RepID=UPI001CDCA62C|nr:balbiani ring protein 3-like [Aphidius gifuensis]